MKKKVATTLHWGRIRNYIRTKIQERKIKSPNQVADYYVVTLIHFYKAFAFCHVKLGQGCPVANGHVYRKAAVGEPACTGGEVTEVGANPLPHCQVFVAIQLNFHPKTMDECGN